MTPPINEPSTENTAANAASEESSAIAGLEVNLGDFTRTQGLMKSLRMTLNSQVIIQAEDIASGLSDAGRKFKMGEIEQANFDVSRLYASFGQKTNQWESQARNLEQQMKTEAAKNPKSISIDKINRMKAEQTAVRTRIRTADVQFRRLHQGLDQAFTNLQSQPKSPSSKLLLDFPEEFLAAFEAASIPDRAEIVSRYFETEAILQVTVTKGGKAGYEIRFDPMPPLDRGYFLRQAGRIIILQQLNPVVVFQETASGETSEMKLVEFVKHIQSGVWLIKRRPGTN